MENICKFNQNKSSDLICTDFIYETTPRLELAVRRDEYIIGIPMGAGGTIRLENKKFDLPSDCVFFVPKGVGYSAYGENFSYIYIAFQGRRSGELIDRVGLSVDKCVSHPITEASALKEFLSDSIRRATEENLDLLAESALLYLLSYLKPESKVKSDLISKITEITNENFTRPSFSLTALSDMIGYDGKYISSAFRKKKGICYTEYLRDLRIKHSIFLIEQGVTSVKNIALLSGYTDALYFSKVFKITVGKSPVSYIKEYYGED